MAVFNLVFFFWGKILSLIQIVQIVKIVKLLVCEAIFQRCGVDVSHVVRKITSTGSKTHNKLLF